MSAYLKTCSNIMDKDIQFKFELLDDPLVEKFKKATKNHSEEGILRITPSNCCLPTRFRDHVDRIRSFTVLPDDVWIVTHPKCGK